MESNQLPVYFADGIQMAFTDHGPKLLIQTADPMVAPTPQGQLEMKIKIVAQVNLTYEHLKLFALIAHRQLVQYEKDNDPIVLKKSIIEAQKIDLAKEW